MKIKVEYYLNEAGRRASLLAGGNGREKQSDEIEATPELLALADVDANGAAKIVLIHYSAPLTDFPAAIYKREEEKAAAAAAAAAAKAAKVTDWEARLSFSARYAADHPDESGVSQFQYAPIGGEGGITAGFSGGYGLGPDDLSADGRRAYDQLRAWISAAEQRQAARAALARESEQAAKIQAAAIRDAERATWIAAYGSERLKLALSLGLAECSPGLYRDERLAFEMPGWIWDCAETKMESEIMNPSLPALVGLKVARQKWPDAYLCKVRPEPSADDDYDPTWREAIRVDDLPWAPERIVYTLLDGRS
jgi:hypothetical protein